MHKGGYRCRCRGCEGRRTLRTHPDLYQRTPRCAHCGAQSWRVDKYRMRVELWQRPCRCMRGYYPFPHRRGSKWCEHNKDWSTHDAEEAFGVVGDWSWRDDPLSFGKRPTTSEEPPF